MKGTLFQKPLELKLHVDGESWRQGESISGTLSVKNHSAETVSLENTQIQLAHGKLRDVRAKDPGAFEILASQPFEANKVEAGKEVQSAWRFSTDRNCPITDSVSSLFLLYGQGSDTTKVGQLQLTFNPDAIIDEFLNVVRTTYRFVAKSQKFTKRGVEIKLSPPTAQSFISLDIMTLGFRFEGDTLEVSYDFQLKKVEATAANFDVKKSKKSLEQSFRKDQYLLPSGRFNFETVEASVKHALSEVESKIVF